MALQDRANEVRFALGVGSSILSVSRRRLALEFRVLPEDFWIPAEDIAEQEVFPPRVAGVPHYVQVVTATIAFVTSIDVPGSRKS